MPVRCFTKYVISYGFTVFSLMRMFIIKILDALYVLKIGIIGKNGIQKFH